MKSLMLLILTVSATVFHAAYAGPSNTVFHSHAGRIHNHPLPAEGVSHRHNGGAQGVIAQSTNRAPIITSSVIYGGADRTPPKPKVKSRTHGSSVITSNTRQIRNHHNIKKHHRMSFSKGDTSCRRGELDCNVCASNVQHQFKKAAAGQISWQTKSWGFNWQKTYPPYNKRPRDIFDGDPAYALGIPDTHIQGFVRTNSSEFPYAGSHSHKSKGGVFVIRQTRDGRQFLSSLHQTRTRHPSGVHVLGKYLMYGEKNILYFKDLNSPNQKNNISVSVPNASFGGGFGVLRLSEGNYLLVTTGPGGQKSGPRYNRFYHLKSKNGRPPVLQHIGSSQFQKPAAWPGILNYSENTSLITECGTGDIYAVHTTGEEKGTKAINGKGYWRLSKIDRKHGKLGLTPLNAFATRQNMTSCNIRAAATVYVNNQNKLEFHCHGYAKDPDGTLFNVLGRSSRGDDKFKFKVGVVH